MTLEATVRAAKENRRFQEKAARKLAKNAKQRFIFVIPRNRRITAAL